MHKSKKDFALFQLYNEYYLLRPQTRNGVLPIWYVQAEGLLSTVVKVGGNWEFVVEGRSAGEGCGGGGGVITAAGDR
jgi:hypothetical protein